MSGYGDDRDLEPNEQRDKDRRDAQDQVDQIAESLEQEGRYIDAGVIRALAGHCADMVTVIHRLRSKLQQLAPKKPGKVKTSGGKDHASARGTISSGGKAVHGTGVSTFSSTGHKHKYNADGVCTALSWVGGVGKKCEARRQRAARKPKQTTIPGVDNGKPGEATP